MMLVNALNLAMAEFHQEAPDRYRRREIHLPVRAPIVFSGDFVNGSTAIENINDPGVNPAVVLSGGGEAAVNTAFVQQASGDYQTSEDTEYPKITSDGGGGLQIDLSAINTAAYTNPSTNPWEGTWSAGAGHEPAPTAVLLSEQLPLDWYGCSVQVDGEANWHRIENATNLARPYQGATGTRNFTVYGDVVPADGWSIERLYMDPILADGHPLVLDNGIAQFGSSHWRTTTPVSLGHYHAASDRKRIGRPYYYGTRPSGSLAKGRISDFTLIVLDPVPSTVDALRLGIVHNPIQFSLSAMQEAVLIPLPDNVCLQILLPLAKEALLDSGMVSIDANLIIRGGDKARKAARLLPQYGGTVQNHVGTRQGY